MLLGAIEGGGTKFVCAIGNEHGEIIERISFPTTVPEETLDRAIQFFENKGIEALGIGTFGPIDVNSQSDLYGTVLKTPKPHWSNFSVIDYLKSKLDIPIALQTDVEAAVLGEVTWGSAKGLSNCIYLTVGTGIGGGAIVNHQFIHGLSHSEMGHILVRRHPNDHFVGRCPFHKDCLEGLASGPAIEERWGKKANELEQSHEAWDIQSDYLAQAIINFMMILSPERIILGGGVMHQQQLFPMIREKVSTLLNGYVAHPALENDMENYIVPPSLKDDVGILGGIALALSAL